MTLLQRLSKAACAHSRHGIRVQRLFSRSSSSLKAILEEKIEKAREEVRNVKVKFGNEILDTCTVSQAYEGMRSFKCMTYEVSTIDPENGIRFRGYTISECERLLPKAPNGEQPLPEGLFWLLLTGEIPSDGQVRSLQMDFAERSNVPERVLKVIGSLPPELPPINQFSAAVLALQQDSVMATEYAQGTPKKKHWEHFLEDTLNLLARLPEVAARIYRRCFKSGISIPLYRDSLDMSANFGRMLGFDHPELDEFLRLYLTIHADDEGGNVFSHTVRLVGSTLSDPYLAFSAGLNSLSGPLHGRISQQALRWILELKQKLEGQAATKENLTRLCREFLKSENDIPGYGHPSLQETDSRYFCMRKFALKHLPGDYLFQLVSILYDVAPHVLREQGKVENLWPTVDAHSGVILRYYGLREIDYHLVPLGMSRAIGPLANLVWDRALGLPIVHPISVSTPFLKGQLGLRR